MSKKYLDDLMLLDEDLMSKKDSEFIKLAETDPDELLRVVAVGYEQNIHTELFLDAVEALADIGDHVFKEAALEAHVLLMRLLDHPWEHVRECAVYAVINDNMGLDCRTFYVTMEKLRYMQMSDESEDVRLSCSDVLLDKYQ